MTGSVQVKKGKWYILLNLKDENGERKRKWIATGLPEKGNKRKAESMLAALRAEYEGTGYVEPTKILFDDFLRDWLESHKPNIEVITYVSYKRIVEEVASYFKTKKVALHDLKSKHIQDYCTHKLAKPKVGPNTVIKHLTVIRKSLQHAKKTRLIKENPADWVEKPKKLKFVGGYYNGEEMTRLLEVIKGSTIEAPLMFAIYFGVRRSEAIGVKWGSIDFTGGKLLVAHKVVPITENGKYRVEASDSLKNKSSYRTMSLDGTFMNFLKELKARQEANKAFFGEAYCTDYEEYVCVDAVGKLLKPDYVTIAFRKLLRKNGLRHIRFHDLRHSCASLLLALGYSLKEIQVYLGHGDISTTMNIYAHVESSVKQTMIEGITKALSVPEKH